MLWRCVKALALAAFVVGAYFIARDWVAREAGSLAFPPDSPHLSPLGRACAVGHMARVEDMLRAGQDIEEGFTVGPFGLIAHASPLFVAARRGHLAVVKALLRAGADPRRGLTLGLGAFGAVAPLALPVRGACPVGDTRALPECRPKLNVQFGLFNFATNEENAARLKADQAAFEEYQVKRVELAEALLMAGAEPRDAALSRDHGKIPWSSARAPPAIRNTIDDFATGLRKPRVPARGTISADFASRLSCRLARATR